VADEFTTLQLTGARNIKTRNLKTTQHPEVMKLHSFASTGDEESDAQAGVLCGDGSIAGYYYLKASKPADRKKWLIWFQGGQPPTSTTWEDTESPISTRFGSEFATWNQVYFRTCSKDSRGGTRLTKFGDQYYQGHLHVVKAMDEILETVATHPAFTPKTVIVGGCSGGSISTLNNVDYIASRLPSGVDIKGKIETGLYFDAVTYDDYLEGDFSNPTGVSINKESAEGMEAFVDESCRVALGENWWKCMMFEHVAQYIETPIHFSEPKFDRWRLYEQYGFDADKNQDPQGYSEEQKGYFKYWGDRVDAVFNNVALQQPNWGYWVPSCVGHCEGTDLRGPIYLEKSSPVDLVTPEQAFSDWYWGRDSEHLIMDACSGKPACNTNGWKCGKGTDCVCGDDDQPLSECSAEERDLMC